MTKDKIAYSTINILLMGIVCYTADMSLDNAVPFIALAAMIGHAEGNNS